MDILGIGPLELVFILLIALIVLGPNDMVKAGRTLGRFLRKLVTSPAWQMVQQTSKDLRYLPNKLMREAGLEEMEELKKIKEQIPTQKEMSKDLGLDDLKQEIRDTDRELNKGLSAWTTTPPKTIKTPSAPLESKPAPNETAGESLAVSPAEMASELAAADPPESEEPKISTKADETDD